MNKSKLLKQTQLHPMSLLNQKDKNAKYVHMLFIKACTVA